MHHRNPAEIMAKGTKKVKKMEGGEDMSYASQDHGNYFQQGVEAYATSMTSPTSEVLQHLEHQTKADVKEANMLCGPLEGTFLSMLVRITAAKRVLELGTYTGYSSLCMAEALPSDGEVITLDDWSDVGEAKELFEKYKAESLHGHKVKLITGNAKESLNTLKDQQPFDLIFIDADKESQIYYYDFILEHQLLSSRGLIVVDNTLWYAKVIEPPEKHDSVTQHIHAFNQHVVRDTRTRNCLLTVRDGISLITWNY
ncbi:O-methyltransferase family protein [Balamuthia mandrillaris]